jgi:hypothetical protein
MGSTLLRHAPRVDNALLLPIHKRVAAFLALAFFLLALPSLACLIGEGVAFALLHVEALASYA